MFSKKASRFLFIASLSSCLQAQDAAQVIRHDPYSSTLCGYMRQIESMRGQMEELIEKVVHQHSRADMHEGNLRNIFLTLNFLNQEHRLLKEGLNENINSAVDEKLMYSLAAFRRDFADTISQIESKTQDARSTLSTQSETLQSLSVNFNQTLKTINQLKEDMRSTQKTVTDIQNAQRQKENPQLKEALAELNRLREHVTQNNYKKEILTLQKRIQKCQEEIEMLRGKNNTHEDFFEQIESIFNSKIAELNHKFERQNSEIEALRKENDDLKKMCATSFSQFQLTVKDVKYFKKIFEDMQEEEYAQKNEVATQMHTTVREKGAPTVLTPPKEAACLPEPLACPPGPAVADATQEAIDKQFLYADHIPFQHQETKKPEARAMPASVSLKAMPKGVYIDVSDKIIPHTMIRFPPGTPIEKQICAAASLLDDRSEHSLDQSGIDYVTAQAITRKFSNGEAVSAREYDFLKKVFTKELIAYCVKFDQMSIEEKNRNLEKIATMCYLDCQMFNFTFLEILINRFMKQQSQELKDHLLCLIKRSVNVHFEILGKPKGGKVILFDKEEMVLSFRKFINALFLDLGLSLKFIDSLDVENLKFLNERFQKIGEFYRKNSRLEEDIAFKKFEFFMRTFICKLLLSAYKKEETEEMSKDYTEIAHFLEKISVESCSNLILKFLKKEEELTELDSRLIRNVYQYYDYFYVSSKKASRFEAYFKENIFPFFDNDTITQERKKWFLENVVEQEDRNKNGFNDFKKLVLKRIS